MVLSCLSKAQREQNRFICNLNLSRRFQMPCFILHNFVRNCFLKKITTSLKIEPMRSKDWRLYLKQIDTYMFRLGSRMVVTKFLSSVLSFGSCTRFVAYPNLCLVNGGKVYGRESSTSTSKGLAASRLGGISHWHWYL